MKYTIAIEKDRKSKWYIGQCAEEPGAISQGRSLEELLSNMEEAITLVLECKGDDFINKNENKTVFYRKIKI